MKLSKILFILLVLLLIPFTLKVRGQDFGRHQSLFTDIKAHQVGDILTVIISEQNRASSQIATKTEKTNKTSAKGGPGVGPLDFIPLFGINAQNKNSFDGKGENVRSNNLRARLSVTVIDVRSNGDLIIEGTRTTGISSDRETITLTGVVRQKDISRDNTIASHQIADAQIYFTGKGPNETAARPGFMTRIFNWLF